MLATLLTVVAVLTMCAASAALYFLPFLVAVARRAPDLGSVAVINVLLGWTLFGWVAALAMALRSASPPTRIMQVVQHAPAGPPPLHLPPRPQLPLDEPPLLLPPDLAGYDTLGEQ